MAVGTFTQPDHLTQDGSAYKLAIKNAIMALARLGRPFAPHEQDTPNMTVRVDAGQVFKDDTLTEKAAQNTGTFTAPGTYDRIDRLVISQSTGVISVVTGVEAASPSPPVIPSGKLPVAQVLLHPSTTAITNDLITDERMAPAPVPPDPSDPELPGVIKPYAGLTPPTGYLFTDGAAVSRATYAALFAAMSIQTTGNFTSGSAVVTSIPSTANMQAGMPISGPRIQSGTVIQSVDSSTQITMSKTASSSGTGTACAVCPFGVGDGSTTFNLPDLRQRMPLGMAASGTGSRLGETGGNINHTHSTPNHTHGLGTPDASGTGALQGWGYIGEGTTSVYHGTNSSGAGTSGSGNPPFVALNFIIKY